MHDLRFELPEACPDHFAHTVWLIDRSNMPPGGRVAVLAIACYQRRDLLGKLWWLFRSAAKHGVLLSVVGIGEEYNSHYSAKIERILRWVQALPDVYDRVVYADAADCFVVGDEMEIGQALNAFAGKTVIGSEACAWPVSTDEWQQAFSSRVEAWGNRKQPFPQAGCWGGEIEGEGGVLNTLIALKRLHYDFKTWRGPDWLYDEHGGYVKSPWDDQLCWQALYRSNYPHLALDSDWLLAANVTCTTVNLSDKSAFSVQDGGLTTVKGCRPPIIHMPGWGKSQPYRDAWGHFLVGVDQ